MKTVVAVGRITPEVVEVTTPTAVGVAARTDEESMTADLIDAAFNLVEVRR